ncbi:MAG: PIG-L family deacetylase [Gemmatimonadota bacterium]
MKVRVWVGRPRHRLVTGLSIVGAAMVPAPSRAQSPTLEADAVATLPFDRGTPGLRQALLRLSTTASLLHTTAHPDDEQAGLLTLLARGRGVRTTLLTLNRGEAGANALGPELFDALGLVRTEELLLAGRWYGLSAQYFTNAVDYGYSKTLDEALRSWDQEAVLGDLVRVLRSERPRVVVSRWHGSERDGHGHHHAAGVLTPLAVAAAADPDRFPDQIAEEGLRPWRVERLYRGGVREGELTHVEIDVNRSFDLLGRSFLDVGSEGLSLQRSQTAGRRRTSEGPVVYRYERLDDGGSRADAQPDSTFFAGLDTSLSGLFTQTAEEAPRAAHAALARAQRSIERASGRVELDSGLGAVEPLAEALAALREAHTAATEAPEARRVLERKILEAQTALRLALGVTVTALATDEGGAVHRLAPGQSFRVQARFASAYPRYLTDVRLTLEAPSGWMVRDEASAPQAWSVRVAADAQPSGAYFARDGLGDTHYSVRDSSALHLPWSELPLRVVASFAVHGETVRVGAPVRGEEPALPYGVEQRRLQVVPPVSVRLKPAVHLLLPSSAGAFRVSAEVEQTTGMPVAGTLSLTIPAGWSVQPASVAFALDAAGERQISEFQVEPAPGGPATEHIEAVAQIGGSIYAAEEQRIVHRDLEPRSLHVPARSRVLRVDARIAPALEVGYVEGVGDQIPDAIMALGARVAVLDDAALAEAPLDRFDAIVVGTRAYAVRPTLARENARLLEYVEAGGHLVVLYQTPEFDAASLAPYAAELPDNAEEVSEEDAPVELLAPEHPLLNAPNRIGVDDFEGWVEQRGSKFFSRWGPEFTALVETHDHGQAPQGGVWLTAPLGRGHYTYVALALHRQTPYAVPGAYRILANLLSFGSR